ncbi:MAG: hypothetical protein M0008_02965 [Actinomycetota bacterium]|nr:hypothetical protein [Actinomycetota bacterium]
MTGFKVILAVPARFGQAAEEFIYSCQMSLAEIPSAALLIGRERNSLPSPKELTPDTLLMGGIASELGLELAHLAASANILHLEVGALGNEVLGPNTLRLTGGVDQTVEIARAAVSDSAYILAEDSQFGESVVGAWKEVQPGFRVAERLDPSSTNVDLSSTKAEIVAIARPPLPENICEILAASSSERWILGIGSWGRRVVGDAIAGTRVRVRFVDVLPSTMLSTEHLKEHIRRSLSVHLRTRKSVYGDLGWAAGLFIHQAVTLFGTKHVSEELRSIRLSVTETGFGHGVVFGSDGRNTSAKKWLLRWRGSEVTLGTNEMRCGSANR